VLSIKYAHYLAHLCLALLLGLLGACASAPPAHYSAPPNQSTAGLHREVVELAHNLIGTPYHYGGRSPRQGFDCSGLVYYTYRQAGLRLPRTSFGQYKATVPVSLRGLRPGDLVFFHMYRNRISHVGIYIGQHKFIHAPSRGKDVMIDDLDDPYWQRRFARGGRTYISR